VYLQYAFGVYVSMCVCMCVCECVCLCVYICMYVCMYMYTHTTHTDAGSQALLLQQQQMLQQYNMRNAWGARRLRGPLARAANSYADGGGPGPVEGEWHRPLSPVKESVKEEEEVCMCVFVCVSCVSPCMYVCMYVQGRSWLS
jgi:hypothetical protein